MRRLLVLLCLAGAGAAWACGGFLGVDDDDEPQPSGGGPDASAEGSAPIIDITPDSGIPIEESSDAAAPAPCFNIDLQVDPKNCGACGRACPGDLICIGGVCSSSSTTCEKDKIACANSTGQVECVDPRKDSNNCGGCANVCNFKCVDGDCELLVFVTTNAFPADGFAGVAGADARCQVIANNAGKKGTFLSWISDGSSSPRDRFGNADGGGGGAYKLSDGKVIADSAKSLLTKGLSHGIDLTIDGVSRNNNAVWTGTSGLGVATGPSCENWSSTASSVPVSIGNTSATNSTWTDSPTGSCAKNALLYCFEQRR